MKSIIIFIALLTTKLCIAQQYDTVIIEEENIDSNNEIYKPGTFFRFNYEIIKGDSIFKLKSNKGMFKDSNFEFTPSRSSDIGVDEIQMLVNHNFGSNRVNQNQTQITYYQVPESDTWSSSTGVVENDANIWIHPIRSGFFNCLETAPFPFILQPLKVGLEWTDEMVIGEGWSNPLWGNWEGSLLLKYHYKVSGKTSIQGNNGNLECYVIESSAISEIGTTKLKSYFSDQYGFLRMEYELLNGLKVNIWLTEFQGQEI